MSPCLSLRARRRIVAAALTLLAFAGLGSTAAYADGRWSVSVGVNVPPGGREFHHGPHRYYAYRGQYYMWDRGRYYRCPPPRGYIVTRPPRDAVRVVIGRDVYYRTDHIYYRPSGAFYEVVEVPVVVEEERRIVRRPSSSATTVPPADALVDVWLDGQRYLLDDGQYFKPASHGRVHVATPVGAKLKALPIGANTVWHEENEYFEFDGGYFRRTPDGFKVVEAPWKEAS